MRRFEPANTFGWTFFVLILASFWSDATVKFGASPSNAPAVASRSASEELSSSPFDATAQTVESEDVASRRDDSRRFAFSARATLETFEANRRGAARRVQDSTRRRLGGAFASCGGAAKSLNIRVFSFSAPGLSSAFFRSFWDCQSVSRPLFLSLRSLLN